MGIYGDVIITRRNSFLDCAGYCAARMLWADSFCCGHPLRKLQEFTGYSTLTIAECTHCKATWEIGDGRHFEQRKSS